MKKKKDRFNIAVTGATGALGKAIVTKLANNPSTRITLFGGRSEKSLIALLGSSPRIVSMFPGNLFEDDKMLTKVSEIVKHNSVIIHAAALNIDDREIFTIKDAFISFGQQMHFFIQMIEALKVNGNGKLFVPIGSLSALLARDNTEMVTLDVMPYAYMKLLQWQILAKEFKALKTAGVTVVLPQPGWFWSDMFNSIPGDTPKKQARLALMMFKKGAQKTTLNGEVGLVQKRVFDPEEVAKPIVDIVNFFGGDFGGEVLETLFPEFFEGPICLPIYREEDLDPIVSFECNFGKTGTDSE